MPAYFTENYKKEDMEFHIMLNFIIIHAVPICNIKMSGLLMLPMLLAGSHLQLQVQRDMYKELFKQ